MAILALVLLEELRLKGSCSVNLNYCDKKINLFGNAGVNIGMYENTLMLYLIQKDTLYD